MVCFLQFYSLNCALILFLWLEERSYPVNESHHGQIPLVVDDNGMILRRVSDSPHFVANNPPAIGHSTNAIHPHPTIQQMAYPPPTSQAAFFSRPAPQARRQAHRQAHQHPSHPLDTVEENLDDLMNSAPYQIDQDNMSSSPFDDAGEVSYGQYGLSGSINPANGTFKGTGPTQWVPTGGVPMRRPPFHPPVRPFCLSYIYIPTHYTEDFHSSHGNHSGHGNHSSRGNHSGHGNHIPPVLFLSANISRSDVSECRNFWHGRNVQNVRATCKFGTIFHTAHRFWVC
jgi:hypothetical protein